MASTYTSIRFDSSIGIVEQTNFFSITFQRNETGYWAVAFILSRRGIEKLGMANRWYMDEWFNPTI
jgi:hypothetical protein